MTRDELIEKVAIAICESRHDEFNWWDTLDGAEKHQFSLEAVAAVDAIFDALKDPTDEMQSAAEEYDWEANHDITFSECFVSMINASPLAKEG